jgi:hypothetical protein
MSLKRCALNLPLQSSAILLLLFLALFPTTCYGSDSTAFIPGNINRICDYTDYFYHFPPKDFLYYLNDRFLFLEKPDGLLVRNGMRKKLIPVILQYNDLKEALARFKRDKSGAFRFNISGPRGFSQASEVLKHLGLRLEKKTGNYYHISMDREAVNIDYYKFALYNIDLEKWNRGLSLKRQFSLRLKETEVPLPWDYTFLREVTGLKLNRENFFRTMAENEEFSLLLGTLYRLSPAVVRYIDSQAAGQHRGVWQEIYKDKRFLMGMFLLSHALRVTDDEQEGMSWKLPGGKDAESFWNQLAEANCRTEPMKFLRQLAVKDQGRLNYLFLFSSFLAPEVRTALFTGSNAQKMQDVIGLIRLNGQEKLKKSQFPQFKRDNFFTLLYTLRMKDKRFYFPLELKTWYWALKEAGAVESAGTITANTTLPEVDIFNLFTLILDPGTSPQGLNGTTVSPGANLLRTFVSLYSKFSNRTHLLNRRLLIDLCRFYPQYSIMVDFIEKLPLKKSATADTLLHWARKLDGLSRADKELFTPIFQSLLELLCHTAKYAPEAYDYDAVVEKLTSIPIDRSLFFDNLFQFFDSELGVKAGQRSLIDALLKGVANRDVKIYGSTYRFMARTMYQKQIDETLQAQDVCSFSSLLTINMLFERLEELVKEIEEEGNYPTSVSIADQVITLFYQLPYAEIGSSAPKPIKERVMPYEKELFAGDMNLLQRSVDNKTGVGNLKQLIQKLKEEYLLPQLKAYLVGLVYAVNAKNSRLRAFLNPNLVRLHDFGGEKERAAWNFSGTPPSIDQFSDYLFQGGLSRMNIALTIKWSRHLFKRTYIHNAPLVRSLLVNLLEIYPFPVSVDEAEMVRTAKMVDSGRTWMSRARQDKNIRQDVVQALGEVASGFKYRKAVLYLNGRVPHHALFFSQLKQLGEMMQPDSQPSYSTGIYFHTFGNLVPKKFRLFPQEVANFFNPGWLSGEMIDEYMVVFGSHLYKKKIPVSLLGVILYSYFKKSAPVIFSQNHPRDYHSSYFLFDIFNDSQLGSLLKEIQKEGHLKLR